ncbi:RagB/SusD family nutrient uptake outer membrane protein [Antarcticibacterium sp. 1MA-6-2]|uniref:RagB/SusD family nutrient uptake outer membrane protein n=1 Tax=Antarcticibacterium sp. 1MA-6-2 TaxID=2908210 RepID=UPI001F1ACE4E|nr:RagB/SusD family nutrient uptake outer membrane protein [Antarcticibacterium sp. 1MA-6-2]UJH90347.1 RagB/SusD family nutrient uptake outer membrane protein [Antarcticibacterium sp. 1MA-6-2]
MKKIKYFIALSTLFVAFSCEDYLDTDNIYGKSLETFYSTPTDINEAMAGVYNAMYTTNVYSNESVAANLMSDMMLGGGGPDDAGAKWVDNFQDPAEDTYRDLWVQSYNGIARANAIIEKAADADFSSFFSSPEEAQQFKDQAIGEAHFMRAFYYFRLAKFFGGVPLIVAINDPKDVARATYSETFAQIASDLKSAIETMPETPFPSIATSQIGHANKWVAEAYMGRVFLFYTGYMTNMNNTPTSDLPLVDGGSLSSADVAAYLEDVINNSGHALASDFRNLWPYSYVNIAAGETVLPWAAEEGLSWVGQDGTTPTFGTGNFETMFAQRFSFGDWGWNNGNIYTNRLSLFSSIRGQSLVPFGEGWGWMTVNPRLWSNWDDSDPRKAGSILEVGNPAQGTEGWAPPGNQDHGTGLYNKKYTALQFPDETGAVKGMFVQLYGWGNADMQLMHAQDFIFMRFADVLLMHSEITGTAEGMNAVRARAGLDPVGYSLEALKEERLHEFAFEGLRWFDLVRWGDVEAAFNYTLNVNNSGTAATYQVNYRPETKGLVPIPETEMRLSNGIYEQNPGW